MHVKPHGSASALCVGRERSDIHGWTKDKAAGTSEERWARICRRRRSLSRRTNGESVDRISMTRRAVVAAATGRAYQSDFLHFPAWCRSAGREAPPATVDTAAAYVASLAKAGLKPSTITRRCAAITGRAPVTVALLDPSNKPDLPS
jgi:hypothetical protein